MSKALTIKELHTIFLGMMEEFHNFCVEHGLTYYMVGGTLLGAVREKGFIPWDDDVDLAMPRPDYERLIQIYSGTMMLKSIRNDKEHLFPYIKLCHQDLPIAQINDPEFQIHSKVFVKFDIYPIDGVGNDKKKALALLKKVRQKKKFLYLNLTSDKSQNIVKNLLRSAIRAIPTRFILRHIDKTMRTYSLEESAYWTRWREGGITANLVDHSVFGNPTLVPFDQYQFYAPQDAHRYLTVVYGDYRTEKRENDGLRHDTDQNEVAKKFAHNLKNE